MRATVEAASVITIVLTQEDARSVLGDWDTTKEPSQAGKVLYSALIAVANPVPATAPFTLHYPPGARGAGPTLVDRTED